MSYAKRLLKIFQTYEMNLLISNIDTQIIEYTQNGLSIPSTLTHKITKNTYVVSPYALMINYGEDELAKIKSPLQKGFFFLLIKFFSSILKWIEVDKVQILNNYLFATNFFGKEWESMPIKKLRKETLKRAPKHNLLIRSINQIQNPNLFKHLCKDGWKPIAVRQIYLYEQKEKWYKSRNTKNDKKLFNSKQFSFVESEDYPLAIEFYNALYLEKYSEQNIHYSSRFLEALVNEGLLKLFFLQDNFTKKCVGVVGVTQEDAFMTVPIIGYDKTYSQKDALYRRLVYKVTSYAFEQGCLLNFSSGASDFKTKRGAKPLLEYMFVYNKHLSLPKRIVWQSIYLLSKYLYAPMLQRLKL